MAAMDGKRTRKDLSVSDKHEILRLLDMKMSQTAIARSLGCSQAAISMISKNRHQILSEQNANPDRKRRRTGSAADVQKALYEWFTEASGTGIHLSLKMLSEKATEIGKELGMVDFNPSTGWLCRWKDRYAIPSFKKHNTNVTKTFGDSDNTSHLDIDGTWFTAAPSMDYKINLNRDSDDLNSYDTLNNANDTHESTCGKQKDQKGLIELNFTPPNASKQCETTDIRHSVWYQSNDKHVTATCGAPMTDKATDVTSKSNLTEREASVTKREAQVAEREGGVTKREANVAERESSVTKREVNVTKRESHVMEREARVTENEANVTEEEAWRCVRNLERFLEQHNCEQIQTLHDLQIVVAKTATSK